MIKIKNLHASIEGKEILKGLNLEVKAGEVHAIMGPNGAGKIVFGVSISSRNSWSFKCEFFENSVE